MSKDLLFRLRVFENSCIYKQKTRVENLGIIILMVFWQISFIQCSVFNWILISSYQKNEDEGCWHKSTFLVTKIRLHNLTKFIYQENFVDTSYHTSMISLFINSTTSCFDYSKKRIKYVLLFLCLEGNEICRHLLFPNRMSY